MKAFDSFSITCKVLICVGYLRLLNKPKSRFKSICHHVYRWFAFLVVVVYSTQHFLFLVQRRDNMDDVFDGLIIMVPQLNLLVKIITINLQLPRIDKINDLINDPIFAAKSMEDEKLLLKHKTCMHLLSKAIIVAVMTATVLWPTSHFVLRYNNENAVVPSYVPFDTKTWGKFALSVALEVLPIFWVGFGHMFLDCIVATYYAQAEVQLKIIKYNLEHLFDTDKTSYPVSQYKDKVNTNLKTRFVYYVQRYDKVAWYTNEVDGVFNPSTSFQFFTSTLSLCMVVYKLSFFSLLSAVLMTASVFFFVDLETSLLNTIKLRHINTIQTRNQTMPVMYCYNIFAHAEQARNLTKPKTEQIKLIYLNFEEVYNIEWLIFSSTKMSVSGTFPIIFNVSLFGMLSFQIFLYCYFGNLVKYESESIVRSVYLSDWLSVSPQFRRLLLIAMMRWSRPITPRVSRIIPLSQSTFIAIFRATYSLYTVLGRKNPELN